MTDEHDDPTRPYVDRALHLLPAIWLGLLIGVSFIATPIKFSAPTLDLGPALDVGRVTFGLFSRIEWGMAVLSAVAIVAAGLPPWRSAAVGLLALTLAVQALWLLPALDDRVASVIAGRSLPPSWHHTAYAGLEAAKAILLLVLACTRTRRPVAKGW